MSFKIKHLKHPLLVSKLNNYDLVLQPLPHETMLINEVNEQQNLIVELGLNFTSCLYRIAASNGIIILEHPKVRPLIERA